MALGVQYSGVWTMAQQFQAVGAGKWKGLLQGQLLWTWGDNGDGELGLNLTQSAYKSSPVQVGTLTTWSQIAAGANWSMAIKTDGTLWTFGYNNTGNLGDNTVIKRSSPVQIGALTTWSKIDAGVQHSIALKTDGTLWTFGYNNYGRLGDGTVINRSSPVQIGSTPVAETTWSKISNGHGLHSMAIRPDGTMWLWGINTYGRLGDNTVIARSSPIQLGALTTWSLIACGDGHSMAIKTDGTMWTWGRNSEFQLGDNTGINKSSPVQIGALTTWSKIAAGGQHSMALKTDGTLWTWGLTGNGRLGDNTAYNQSSPVQIGALTTWSQISAGFDYSMALKTDGTMWLWGTNNYGQVGGNFTGINRSSPIQIGSLTTWSQISAGYHHAAAIKTDGTLWLWGKNNYSQVGDNTAVNKSSPVQIGALTTWSKVSNGNEHTMALKTDGTMWLWGRNTYGRLGDNNTAVNQSSPIQVGALTTWSQISAGNSQSGAVETDGAWYSWGRNNSGQLGDNTVINKSSPVQIGGEIYGWSLIASGGYSCMALKTDGTMWLWGFNNNYGHLGDETRTNKSSPIQIGALTTWSKIDGGDHHSMAIKTDGTMWLWGRNDYGQLGDNTVVFRSSPVQIGALTTWSKIAGGGKHSMAIKTDGTMWLWGRNSAGNIGDSTFTINKSSPIQIGALTTWSQISAKSNISMALKTDGTMWLWGNNNKGQIGNDTNASRSSPVQIGALTNWSLISTGGYHSMAIAQIFT